MDLDDSADMYAILGLAGVGVALMVVGTLDLWNGAVVLAVVIPTLAAVLSATLSAVACWWQTRRRTRPPHARTGRAYRQ